MTVVAPSEDPGAGSSPDSSVDAQGEVSVGEAAVEAPVTPVPSVSPAGSPEATEDPDREGRKLK